MTYTQEEALKKLWSCKGVWKTDAKGELVLDANGRRVMKTAEDVVDVFLYATLRSGVEMRDGRVVPEGTAVLVTMVSRFGDVGIRADRLMPPSHGYDARVIPQWLTNWRDAP